MTNTEPEPGTRNPLDYRCPNCGAPSGKPCTQPTFTGRSEVAWVHDARKDLAQGWT